MRKLALHWQIIIGLVLGVAWALLSAQLGWSKFTLNWIDPFGQIFIRLLKLIAVPLVLFSVIKGVSGLTDVKRLGRLGAKTIAAYLLTTFFAVCFGLLLVNLIQPGTSINQEQRIKNRVAYEQFVEATPGDEYQAGDEVRMSAKYPQYVSESAQDVDAKIQSKITTVNSQKSGGPLKFIVDMVPQNIFYAISDGKGKTQMLQVIFFAIFFGIVLLFIDPVKAKPVINLVDGINEVFMKMVDVIMQWAPFFVFALLAGTVSKIAGDDPAGVIEIFKGLAVFAITVLIGLGTMVFIVYPLLANVFTGRKISYGNFFKSIAAAQTMAFSTSSSAATLPVTLDCVRENLKVSPNISNFVLPIGATVNMDGTSMYQGIVVLFLAQAHMIDLSTSAQLTIMFMAVMASIGSAAVPSAGLIMLILVLESVGLNPAWIALIFPIDRPLDMCRTVVNVTGDASVTTIIAHSEDELLFDPETDFQNFEIENE